MRCGVGETKLLSLLQPSSSPSFPFTSVNSYLALIIPYSVIILIWSIRRYSSFYPSRTEYCTITSNISLRPMHSGWIQKPLRRDTPRIQRNSESLDGQLELELNRTLRGEEAASRRLWQQNVNHGSERKISFWKDQTSSRAPRKGDSGWGGQFLRAFRRHKVALPWGMGLRPAELVPVQKALSVIPT